MRLFTYIHTHTTNIHRLTFTDRTFFHILKFIHSQTHSDSHPFLRGSLTVTFTYSHKYPISTVVAQASPFHFPKCGTAGTALWKREVTSLQKWQGRSLPMTLPIHPALWVPMQGDCLP